MARARAAAKEFERLTTEATLGRSLLDHFDQAILSKASRGELVPRGPNDESASTLLRHIRAERRTVPAARWRSCPPRVA